MLWKIILWRLFTRLIWLTLSITCSVTYTCHRIHQIPIWNNINEWCLKSNNLNGQLYIGGYLKRVNTRIFLCYSLFSYTKYETYDSLILSAANWKYCTPFVSIKIECIRQLNRFMKYTLPDKTICQNVIKSCLGALTSPTGFVKSWGRDENISPETSTVDRRPSSSWRLFILSVC